MAEQIEGRNPVLESLRAGHDLTKIYLLKSETTGPLRQIFELASAKRIPISQVDGQALNRLSITRNHQGVIAMAAGWKYAALEEILAKAAQKEEPPFLLLLDGVEDPQNLGSIIRTAEAAGIDGLIIPERRAVGLTTAVARASAGAVEYLPVARVTNLSKTIESLKQAGFWITGAEMDGKVDLFQSNLTGPIGLVVGGEGKGLSRLVAEHCDQVVRLPMWGEINSLNVAVATGILLYEVRRQRIKL